MVLNDRTFAQYTKFLSSGYKTGIKKEKEEEEEKNKEKKKEERTKEEEFE